MLERETHQGKGSTGKSMGGVRAQFATAPNIQMSMYSIQFYAEFDERLGQPGGYRPQGYLFVATRPEHLEYLRTNHILQRSLGLKQAQMVSRDDIKARVPQLFTGDVLGGSFCPTDGFVDPYSVMVGFTTCATEHGAKVWRSTEVTAIHRNGTGITGRRNHPRPRQHAGCGERRGSLGSAGGGARRHRPSRRNRCAACWFPTEPFHGVSHEIPMVIDMTNGFHFRPESLGFLLAWNDPEETIGYKTDFEASFIEKILMRAADRVPCFENVAVNPKKAWAGLYEMSPDHHCILGPVEDVPGFFCANGFSGHGVMHAPSTGTHPRRPDSARQDGRSEQCRDAEPGALRQG